MNWKNFHKYKDIQRFKELERVRLKIKYIKIFDLILSKFQRNWLER